MPRESRFWGPVFSHENSSSSKEGEIFSSYPKTPIIPAPEERNTQDSGDLNLESLDRSYLSAKVVPSRRPVLGPLRDTDKGTE